MNNHKQNDTEELYMYKNYNMSQITLPIETEITFPKILLLIILLSPSLM